MTFHGVSSFGATAGSPRRRSSFFSGPNNREPIEVAEVMITTEANVRHGQIGGRHEDNSLIDAEGSLAGGAQRIQDWTGVLYA